MRSKFKPLLVLLILASCASPPPPKPLTMSEQIEADSQKVQSFENDFLETTQFVNLPKAQVFLTKIAKKLALQEAGFVGDRIVVKIHNDQNPKLRHFFSFPGTLISVPYTFLKKVEFENELASALALELSHVVNRHLAIDLEANPDSTELFYFSQEQREASIKLGSKFLYYAGYDLRGMASIFSQYPDYYVEESTSDLFKKEVEFDLRVARRAKSEYLPSLKPIVRSGEFIRFKKELTK